MNIEHIQEKLNAIFQEPSRHRKLVLWYDDNGDFASTITSLSLADADIVCLNGHNAVSSKYRILCEEKEKNFLIYAPFKRPEKDDETNHFLDISFYAIPFYADALYDLCEAYGIPKELKPVLAEEGRFWHAEGNAKKVQALGLMTYTAQSLRRAVMAVLGNVKTTQLDEIVKAVLRLDEFDSDANGLLKKFRHAHVEEAFWHDVSVEYGYVCSDDRTPNLTDFMLHCVASYWAQKVCDVPTSWPMSCQPNTTAAVFLSNLLAHEGERPWLDAVLQRISRHLGVRQWAEKADWVSYGLCDLFTDLDEVCIRQASRLVATSPREFNEKELKVLHFRETTAHYGETYFHYYKAIEYAAALGTSLREYESEVTMTHTVEEMMRQYTSSWCNVDVYYRKFYEHFDVCADWELLGALPQAVEEAYVQRYVEPLASRWGQCLKKLPNYLALPGMKQADFFSWYVKPKKDMVAVIISDALRYECGKELYHRMDEDPNMTPKLDAMIANVPTYTQLGMASLLPPGRLMVQVKSGMLQALQNGRSTVGSAHREVILQEQEPKAKVMRLDEVVQSSRAALRQALKDVRVLYVYHDAVDSTGDNMKTEDKVFMAATQGMEDIIRCVKKLAVDKSIVHFFVTADHGFLYRRSDVPTYMKMARHQAGAELYRNKRFLISSEPIRADGVISWPLTQLGQDEYVQFPVGCDIFSLPGGGQHFVHGGVTLQELVVPVISIKYTKQKVDTAKVTVKWYSPQTRLTALHNYLTFIQEEGVTDTKLARTVTVVIEDEAGQVLSNEVTIIANRVETNAVDRLYTEKLMLRDQSYANVPASLVIRDADDGTELARYEVQIDVLMKPWTL